MLETPPYTSRLTLRLPKDQSKQRTGTRKGGGSPEQTLQPASPSHLRDQTQHYLSNLLHTNSQPRLCKTLPLPSFPAVLSLAGERPVPPCSPSGHAKWRAPPHAHTPLPCQQLPRKPHPPHPQPDTPCLASSAPAAKSIHFMKSIPRSRGRRPLQLSALHVVINNSKAHTQSQE